MLAGIGTAVVQGEVRQRLVQATDTISLVGTTESWLPLPERPVTEVSSVSLDGQPIDDWQLHGSRLWRPDGWAASAYEPTTVEVTYTHGYPPGHQALQQIGRASCRERA